MKSLMLGGRGKTRPRGNLKLETFRNGYLQTECSLCIDSIQKKKWAILGVGEILYLDLGLGSSRVCTHVKIIDLYTYDLHFVLCKFYLNRF